MKAIHLFGLATASLLAWVWVACGSAGYPTASDTDGSIESSFEKTYVYTYYLKDDHIKIQSKDGTATLTGTVKDAAHKRMAEHTAEALPGVKVVKNRIDVTGEKVTENSDAWILSKVKAALLLRRNVSGTTTEVEVADGMVILRGEAANAAQKELTAEYAKDVEGVTEVKNEMTIAARPTKSGQTLSEYIDDASITAQVRMALLSHRSTSALKTKVGTKDGVVTLGGEANNAAEKDLVAKLVADIKGVKSVVNNMTIGKEA
jgi:hyperosmotically inducible protein